MTLFLVEDRDATTSNNPADQYLHRPGDIHLGNDVARMKGRHVTADTATRTPSVVFIQRGFIGGIKCIDRKSVV